MEIGRTTDVMDRRHASRFPPETRCVVLRTKLGEQTAASIEDETFESIKLSLEFTIGVAFGDDVFVVHEGFAMAAVVRCLDLDESGKVVAELEWLATAVRS